MLPYEIGNLFKLQHLDIRGANLLRKMPFGIDKLINLEKLSDLILGEGEGDRIREIRNFSCLRGGFCLSRLDNIINEKDAWEAKLFDKLGIDELELKWSKDFDNNERKENVEEKVLEFLYPHKTVKKLSIENYGGIKFSTWITDPSFNNLSSLKLINCKNCNSLPSIGRLPLLKDVWITGMVKVTKVGVEFFGVNTSNSFVSLESLHFEDMLNWKEWDCCEGEEQGVSIFPKLHELALVGCPQLVGRLPNHLLLLQKLVIERCQQLVVSVSSLPLLCELEIHECEEVMLSNDAHFNSLKKVTLANILKYNISEERVRVVHQISSSSEAKAEHMEEETLQLAKISNIESLTIRECEKLCNRFFKVLSSFKFLKEMKIENCSGLVSLSEISFLPALKKLVINNCEDLESLCNTFVFVEHLEIRGCDSLVRLSSRDDMASQLQHVKITGCTKLTELFLNSMLPIRLKELNIWHCPNLESVGDEFGENNCLESIDIYYCEKIKYLPRGLYKLRHLQSFWLGTCSELVISEEYENFRLPTHLKKLSIRDCPKIEALPKNISNFTSLGTLEVESCSADICFPDEGFPTHLTNLTISAAPKMYNSLVEWGFHKLTCLQKLTVGGEGCSEEEIPGRMMQLPPSLTLIQIENFENLKCISPVGFQNLTSLQCLQIYGCPKLASLPEKHMLLSLGQLRIGKCPLLKEECEKDKGSQWSKIAHIPLVRIDDQTIVPRHL